MDWFWGVLDGELLRVWGWRLAAGVVITIKVVVISCVLGFLLAYPIARARMSARVWLYGPALAYVACFRGTPLLCQLYLVYYGAGEVRPWLDGAGVWWFFRDSLYCCLLTFTLNTAAYQSEIVRGALLSVPAGQVEAGRALGLSGYRLLRHVVGPQAMLIALRPFGNELITVTKSSALTAIVTVLDLMGQTRYVFARTFDFDVYLYAALVYLMLTEVMARAFGLVERRLGRHLQPRIGTARRDLQPIPFPEPVTHPG